MSMVRAAAVDEVREQGCVVAHVNGHTLALFAQADEIFAVDNRCPHMGFPLHRGHASQDGILTCHWHHARFDLCTGGTFDQWADDLRALPGRAARRRRLGRRRAARPTRVAHQRKRLARRARARTSRSSSRRRRSLSIGGVEPVEPFRDRARVRRRVRARRRLGPGPDHARLLREPRCPRSSAEDRAARALPRPRRRGRRLAPACRRASLLGPLPGGETERRRARSAGSGSSSRCATPRAPSAASSRPCAPARRTPSSPTCSSRPRPTTATSTSATSLDFTNKALEALDIAGWEHAETVLASLAAAVRRRRPHGGVERLAQPGRPRRDPRAAPSSELPAAAGAAPSAPSWEGRAALVDVLLGEDPQAIARRAPRGAPRRRAAGRARRRRRLRRRDCASPASTRQRVRRLGHRAAHVHVRERRPAGPAPGAVAPSCCAASSTPR